MWFFRRGPGSRIRWPVLFSGASFLALASASGYWGVRYGAGSCRLAVLTAALADRYGGWLPPSAVSFRLENC